MKPPPSADHPQEFAALRRDEWMFGDGVVVLMYHKIAPPPATTRLPFLYVHPGQLERQLDELLARPERCVPFGEVVGAAAGGANGFCLTFDDGFRNVFDAALPILVKKGLPSIQFIVASLIGREDAWDRAIGEPPQPLMDNAQIREWLAAGQTIGSHTLTHPRLAEIPLEEARREIFDSKKLLEDRFGLPVTHFCYPYGSYNEAIRDLVGEAGYSAACTVEFGAAASGIHPHALPRVMATDLPPAWRTAAKKLARRLRRFTRDRPEH